MHVINDVRREEQNRRNEGGNHERPVHGNLSLSDEVIAAEQKHGAGGIQDRIYSGQVGDGDHRTLSTTISANKSGR